MHVSPSRYTIWIQRQIRVAVEVAPADYPAEATALLISAIARTCTQDHWQEVAPDASLGRLFADAPPLDRTRLGRALDSVHRPDLIAHAPAWWRDSDRAKRYWQGSPEANEGRSGQSDASVPSFLPRHEGGEQPSSSSGQARGTFESLSPGEARGQPRIGSDAREVAAARRSQRDLLPIGRNYEDRVGSPNVVHAGDGSIGAYRPLVKGKDFFISDGKAYALGVHSPLAKPLPKESTFLDPKDTPERRSHHEDGGHAISFARGYKHGMARLGHKRIKDQSKLRRVVGSEYMFSFPTHMVAAFVPPIGATEQVQPLNPRFFSGTKLQLEAEGFDKFRFRKIAFEYEPECPTTSTGALLITYEPDPMVNLSGTASVTQLRAYFERKGALDIPVWQKGMCEMTLMQDTWLDLLFGDDPEECIQGYFQTFITNSPAANVSTGRVIMHYDVEFRSSDQDPVANPNSPGPTLAVIDNTKMGWVNAATEAKTIGAAAVDGLVYIDTGMSRRDSLVCLVQVTTLTWTGSTPTYTGSDPGSNALGPLPYTSGGWFYATRPFNGSPTTAILGSEPGVLTDWSSQSCVWASNTAFTGGNMYAYEIPLGVDV